MTFDQTASEARLYQVTQDTVSKRKLSVRIAAPPHEAINTVTPTVNNKVDERLCNIEKMVRSLQKAQPSRPATSTPSTGVPRSTSGQTAWIRPGRGTPPPSRPSTPPSRQFRTPTPPADQSTRQAPSTVRPLMSPQARRRPFGRYVCGQLRCHSDRHANLPPPNRRPQSPATPCWTCGQPGCRSWYHTSDPSGSTSPPSQAPRSQPVPPPGNGPRSSDRGDRTPRPHPAQLLAKSEKCTAH